MSLSSSSSALAVALGGMAAMIGAMGIGRFVYTPILPFMVEALSLSQSDAGLIAAANFLGYLLGALFAAGGYIGGSRRRWAVGALAASAATTAAMGLADSVPWFVVLRFAGGVASAVMMVFTSSLVLDRLAAAGRGQLSHVHFAGVGAGIAVSAVLVAWLATAGFGWATHWIASGAAAALALAAFARLVRDDEPTGSRPTAVPEDRPGPRRRALIVAYGLFGFGYVITATFISTMVRLTPAIAAIEPWVWLAVGLAAIPSVWMWTRIGRRLGNATSFALACLAEAAGVAMSVLLTDAAAILAAAVLLGGTFMGLTALGLIMAREMTAGDPRRILALMTASFGLGQMIGPAFAGYVSESTGSFIVPSLTAAVLLVIAAAMVMQARTH